MKKLLSIALAVVMVLGVASVAMAFTWNAPAASAQPFEYAVDVIKYTRNTAGTASYYFTDDNNAAAINGADVYWAIKLTVPGLAADNSIRENAKVDIEITALDVPTSIADITIDISRLDKGEYYFYYTNQGYDFYTVSQMKANNWLVNGNPVFSTDCLDTDTAKVSAKVYSKPNLRVQYNNLAHALTVGGYKVFFPTDYDVVFHNASDDAWVASFKLDSNDKVISVAQATNADIVALYQWLNSGDADSIQAAIDNGEMYMTNDNLLAAFSFNYSQSDSVTWNASSTPIILDPIVSIPKTGDNASVIGFAMIMVAVVAAAVAVKKVRA